MKIKLTFSLCIITWFPHMSKAYYTQRLFFVHSGHLLDKNLLKQGIFFSSFLEWKGRKNRSSCQYHSSPLVVQVTSNSDGEIEQPQKIPSKVQVAVSSSKNWHFFDSWERSLLFSWFHNFCDILCLQWKTGLLGGWKQQLELD